MVLLFNEHVTLATQGKNYYSVMMNNEDMKLSTRQSLKFGEKSEQ
jgi:hypothetical protein